MRRHAVEVERDPAVDPRVDGDPSPELPRQLGDDLAQVGVAAVKGDRARRGDRDVGRRERDGDDPEARDHEVGRDQ